MDYFTAEESLAQQLSRIDQPTEFRDSTGKVLGHFLPVDMSRPNDCDGNTDTRFDLDQAERDLKHGLQGQSLEEFWKKMSPAGQDV
jgi:hypothetical protein